MDWTILSRERPSRARLLALTLSFLCTIAAVRVSGNAAAVALTPLLLAFAVVLLTELAIELHYRCGFEGRVVLCYRRGQLRIWSRGRFVPLDPQQVRDWFTRRSGPRLRIGLRLHDGSERTLRPRIVDPEAERRMLAVLEGFLGRPRPAPGRISMVPYACCA